MSRINLTDSFFEIAVKLAEGNPGALTVISQILTNGKNIDPDDFMEGLSTLLHLDEYEIYASEIWILYKDICGENISKFMALFRAVQLGFYSRKELQLEVSSQVNLGKHNIPIERLCAEVKARLPRFQLTTNDSEVNQAA